MSTEPIARQMTAQEACRELLPLLLDMDGSQKGRMMEMVWELHDAILATIDAGVGTDTNPKLRALQLRLADEEPTLMRAGALMMIALLSENLERRGGALAEVSPVG